MTKPKLIRVTTVPVSLDKLLEGQLHFMKDYFQITAISSNEKGYLKKIAGRENVDFHSIELTRTITPLADLKSLWEMYLYFKKNKPLIVHTHTPKAGTVGMIAAKIAGVPIRLHTVAGMPLMESHGLKRILLNTVEKITYAAASKILPNSKCLKEFILKEGFCKENKLEIIGKGSSNGINTKHFNPDLFNEETKEHFRNTLNISSNDFVFIFIGRIVKDKGIVELINAFKSLKDKAAKLMLVGDFEQELNPLSEDIIEEINTNPNIIHTGWQTDVRPYLSISDALTFPSYREGFPNVVMQAGAMGLPSIVSDINGCNEIIIHHKNGIIIPVKNELSLTKAMELLLEDKVLYTNMKLNARSKIKENYDQSFIWNEIKRFYDNEISKLN